MKAVVLVGGEGTRMRPLTETVPKPLLPLVDRPFLDHVLHHLARHGVEEALLSSPYLESTFHSFLSGRRGPPEVTWFTEETPLGTGGAVANAARSLEGTFLVLNGDILTDLDLTALVQVHRDRGGAGTIALTPVEDARPYGLVVTGDGGRVAEFREKPEDPVPGLVNAGTYVLEPECLLDVPRDRAVSIERDVFPGLIGAGVPLFGFPSTAYWIDVGTPERYLRATFDALEGRIDGLVYTAPHVDRSAEVSLLAHLGRWVVIGPRAVVDDHAEIEDSVVLAGARIGAGARVRDSVIGPSSWVAPGVTMVGAVLGEEAEAPADSPGERMRPEAGSGLRGD